MRPAANEPVRGLDVAGWRGDNATLVQLRGDPQSAGPGAVTSIRTPPRDSPGHNTPLIPAEEMGQGNLLMGKHDPARGLNKPSGQAMQLLPNPINLYQT